MSRARTTSTARSAVQERSSTYIELTKPRISFMVLLTVAIGYALAPIATTSASGWSLVQDRKSVV